MLSVLILVSGCGDPSRDRAPSSDARQNDGSTLPRIVETASTPWPGAWGKGRRVRYETALRITDVGPLRQEAESLWATLRASAERDSICTVELKASARTLTVPVPGAPIDMFARRNYSFLIRHDSTRGGWRWLTAADTPSTPCRE
jgi:hypothetical protein